jgi:hypothetical protein
MKTVTVPPQATDIHRLLEQAQHEDLLVRAADGSEYLLSPVDDFEYEVARTRRNTKLMALLDERAKQVATIPLEEVKRQLGLGA